MFKQFQMCVLVCSVFAYSNKLSFKHCFNLFESSQTIFFATKAKRDKTIYQRKKRANETDETMMICERKQELIKNCITIVAANTVCAKIT